MGSTAEKIHYNPFENNDLQHKLQSFETIKPCRPLLKTGLI